MAFFKRIFKPIENIGKAVGSLLGLRSIEAPAQEAAPAAPEPPDPVAPTAEVVNAAQGNAQYDRDRRRRGSIAATRSFQPTLPIGAVIPTGRLLLGG